MAGTDRARKYADMTAEELEQRLREAFFFPDVIDETVFRELEAIREALEEKRPVGYGRTARESWAQFAEEYSEELASLESPGDGGKLRGDPGSPDAAPVGPSPFSRADPGRPLPPRPAAETAPSERKAGRPRGLLRRGLIAAVIVVLLAGAALAADYTGLWAWALRWNAAAGRYEPAAMEASGEGPILETLAKMGITESVYPAKLPEGFVITESRISEDPLVLFEQYARKKERLSIAITPIKGFETVVYQKAGGSAQEYVSGKVVHYAFETENTITVVWYTKHYATTISGNITREEIKGILDSIDERSAG